MGVVEKERVDEVVVDGFSTPPRQTAVAACAHFIATRAMRRVAGHAMRGVRLAGGLPGFATAMIGVDTFRRENATGDTVRVRQWHYTEEPRAAELIPGSEPVPPLGPVRTTVSLLDVQDRRYSLRDGYLVDPALRVVYEEHLVSGFPFRGIALSRLEEPRPVDGVVACLRQEDNYGHFLLLALPLLDYYREALGGDPDYYYLGPTARPWVYEALERLGIPRSKTLTEPVTADRLLVAIADREEGYDRHFLLHPDQALRQSQVSPPKPARRVFISRANATQRRLLNEVECIAALHAVYGVEPVATERLSLDDEIATFQEAELIVGTHGAGMINCVFSPPGAAVVELASETHWYPLTAQLSVVKEQRFALLTGPPAGLRLGIPASKHDFTVDVERLLEVVGNAIVTEAR